MKPCNSFEHIVEPQEAQSFRPYCKATSSLFRDKHELNEETLRNDVAYINKSSVVA